MQKKMLALPLAAILAFGGVGTAVAVGGQPAPTAGQTLAEYMNDGKTAEWDKVQTWIESEYGEGANPTATATAEPTVEPATHTITYDLTATATNDNRIVLSGTVTGYEGPVTFRASAYEFTGQAGYPVQGTIGADGTVNLEVTDFNNTDPVNWQLEKGGDTYNYGEVFASGTVQAEATTSEPAPTTEPTTEPVSTTADWSNLRNTTFTSWTDSSGITSEYHIWSNHVDTSKKVGLLVYGDGSGEHGLENPGTDYLIAGTNGLLAAAKKHNLILVTPMAPGTNCTDRGGDCWYGKSDEGITPEQKTNWSGELIMAIQSGLPGIDKSRVAIGGYSSGAQWTTQFFGPRYADDIMTDGVLIPISYGGAPRVTAEFPQSLKDKIVVSWDTGDQDDAYGTDSWEVLGGKSWYDNNGFATELNVVYGEDHYRSGQFGAVVERELSQHLPAA